MKRIIFLQIVAFALVFLGCSGPKDPTFEKFENIKVKSIKKNEVILTGEMVLNNPNAFSCHLKNMNLEVYSESDIKLTAIEQRYNTEMLAKSSFKLPVEIKFAPDKLLGEKVGLFNSILSVLSEKEVTLRYKGTCKVEALEITIDVPIDFKETMVLKK